MSEKFVYAVTPDYMLPLIEESKMYSFYVKAYPSAKSGYMNLHKTNLSSILGFILFYEELPDNLTYIIKFINFINLIGNKDTLVVLAVNDPDGVQDFLIPKLEVGNIEFKYITGFEVVTDSFIRKSLFGSIVLHNFEPYIEEVEPYSEITQFNNNVPLTPILPSDIMYILSPVIKLNNSENTIKHDSIMNSNIDSNLVLYMRVNYIRASFGEDLDIDGIRSRIKSIEGINTIIYESIINIMERLRLTVIDSEENLGNEIVEDVNEEEFIIDEESVEEVIEEEIVSDEIDYENLYNYDEDDENDSSDMEDDLDLLNI